MADSGFVIDEAHYDVPSLDSFDMNEAQILYDLSKLALEDFAVDEGDPEAVAALQENIRNPGFIRALMTVAYLRGNKGTSRQRAEQVIGSANLVSAIKSFAESVEADAGPPELTKIENVQHAAYDGSAFKSDLSGASSTPSSDAERDSHQNGTGTSESDMSRDKGRELLERGSRLT